jgi:glutaredoxin
MMRKVLFDCPYCGAAQETMTDDNHTRTKLVTCDIDNGGCDEIFAITVRWVPVVYMAKLDWQRADDEHGT